MAQITVELQFVKDAPTYVEGKDARGYPRAFEKSTHAFRIVGNKLFVEVDERLWERRMSRTPVVKPARAKKASKKKRNCLICSHPFTDQPQMRICPTCKKTANWKSGGEFGLFS